MFYQVAELEEELESKWKSKMADALTAARKESEKRVNEVKEEKEAIRRQALKLKEKVSVRMWVCLQGFRPAKPHRWGCWREIFNFFFKLAANGNW